MGVGFAMYVLEHEVRDDRFVRIIDDIARLIASSEDACERAVASGNDDFADAVIATETDYLEDLIGTIFLMLQTKIRRVGEAAMVVSDALERGYGAAAKKWAKPPVVRAEGGAYNGTPHSLVELVWAVGNYFKHRDEWSSDVWTPPATITKGLKQSIATRTVVQSVGVVESSTGNMRTALEFFGVDPYSSCGKLAQDVQAWADTLLDDARAAAKAAQGTP